MKPTKKISRRLRLPSPNASHQELDRFFHRHDGVELIEQGVMEIDPDHSDLEHMLAKYWKEANTRQLNIRVPATAKRMIEKLARRKTVAVSTLVRMWVIEGMRREATQG